MLPHLDAKEILADTSENQYALMPKKKLTFIPINDGGTHWSLLVFSFAKRSFVHYDSSHLNTNDPFAKEMASTVASLFSFSTYSIDSANCAKQNNGYDCGVYLIMHAELLASSSSKYATMNAPAKRLQILEDIKSMAAKTKGIQ